MTLSNLHHVEQPSLRSTLPGTLPFGTGRSLTPKIGLPLVRSSEQPAGLADRREPGIVRPFCTISTSVGSEGEGRNKSIRLFCVERMPRPDSKSA